MADRERLIELIEQGKFCPYNGDEFDCQDCPHGNEKNCTSAFIADYLISHGVTVQKQGEADNIEVQFIGIGQPDCSKEIYTFKFDFEINGNDYHYRHELTSEFFEIFGYEKVKHGRWIYEGETLNTSSGYRCSACRAPLWLSPDVPQAFIYCPKCGAKMDGEADGA